MRGFPLLNALMVLAAFAVAWWPLRQSATGSAVQPIATVASEAASPVSNVAPPANFSTTLRVFASSPITSLRIEFLGKPLIDEGQLSNTSSIEKELTEFPIPEEGIEFWVEATFSDQGIETDLPPSAIGIELEPDDREARRVTLWTDEFDPASVSDSVVFDWND